MNITTHTEMGKENIVCNTVEYLPLNEFQRDMFSGFDGNIGKYMGCWRGCFYSIILRCIVDE